MVTSIMKKGIIRERKKNRRQTIAVWITTCIATALFAAVFSFASSCQAGLIEYAKDLSGDYDYVFYDVPREEADHIVNNRKVATAYQSVGLGYAKLSGSKNPDKPYVYLTAMDNRAMQKNALHLIKGRMPKNDHEILLSRHMMTNGGVEYRVGDTITLDISEREDKNGNVLTQSSGYRTGEKLKKKLTASFQVVGIVQRPNFGFEEWTAPGYSVITYLNPKGDNILEKYMQRTDIYCKYTKAGLRDRAQTTADIVGVTLTPGVQKFPFIKDERITNRQINDLMERSLYRFYENWGLIRFERMDIGQSAYHMLYLAVAVTNVIILAAAVSCIGSSFAISMEEKRKSYGMLASVGATPTTDSTSPFLFRAPRSGACNPSPLPCRSADSRRASRLLRNSSPPRYKAAVYPTVPRCVPSCRAPTRNPVSRRYTLSFLLFRSLSGGASGSRNARFCTAWYPSLRREVPAPFRGRFSARTRQAQAVSFRSSPRRTCCQGTRLCFR